jgi:tetratricopeptide (TPR) repeat protein
MIGLFSFRAKGFAMSFGNPMFLGVMLLVTLSGTLSLPALSQTKAADAVTYSRIRDAAQAIASGNISLAEAELHSVLEVHPDDYRALNLLGVVRAQQQRNQEAENLFKKAIAQKPDFASGHVDLALLYAQTNRSDQAIPELKKALELDAGRSDARTALLNIYRTQAREAAQGGNLEKALSLLIQARKAGPQDPGTLYDFGMVALRMSLYPDATHAFQELLQIRKDDPEAIYALGRTQMMMAKFQDAQVQFQKYVNLRPDDASGHYALGLVFAALQQEEGARKEFEDSIGLQPEQTESYFQLGVLDLEAGNLDAAAGQLNRVLTKDPLHASALAAMGQVEFERKNYSAASDLLTKAVGIDPAIRQAHYYLGLTYARLGQNQESQKELAVSSKIEHEEVERHRIVFELWDPGKNQAQVAEAPK